LISWGINGGNWGLIWVLERTMKQWRFFWRSGHVEIGEGKTVKDAFTSPGYSAEAIGALEYYEEVK